MGQGKAERSPLEPPDGVDLVLEFVNTHADAGGRVERFEDAGALARWLSGNGFPVEDGQVTSADAAAARELRDALVTLLLAHSGDETLDAEALRLAEGHVQRVATRYPLVPVIRADGASLLPQQAGVPGAFGSVLATVTLLAQSGAWTRLKACRNQPCHFGFFDRTRNGSAFYCGSACGSQVSMRAYRQRKKAQAG
ncbi:CGNR zinc finger domain-containing protein [Streptomyces sp. NPDC056785]|uniref:CGNR zinc finger domain-containing protein n=1 Tax=Streptomyces sp. NPDC056785 TaxID=3345944 RepID=UPI0036B43F67